MFNDDKDRRNGLPRAAAREKPREEEETEGTTRGGGGGGGRRERALSRVPRGVPSRVPGGEGGRRRGRGRRGRVARSAEGGKGKYGRQKRDYSQWPPRRRSRRTRRSWRARTRSSAAKGRRRAAREKTGRRRRPRRSRRNPRRAEAADDAGRHARVRRQRFGSGETRASSRYPSRSAGARRRGEGDGGATYPETPFRFPEGDVPLGVIQIPHQRSTRLATTSDVARLSTIRTERTRAVVSFASSLTRFLHP